MKYLIPLAAIFLSACSSTSYYQQTRYIPYHGYNYEEYDGYYGPNGSQYYQGESRQYSDRDQSSSGQVSVPNSYHVGRYRSPESPQSRDQRWVNRQYNGGYTIELSRGSKASQVAKDLMRAPKNNRTAAVRSGHGYVGVYGTYNNYQDARNAMNKLPPELRRKARIKRWGSVR